MKHFICMLIVMCLTTLATGQVRITNPDGTVVDVPATHRVTIEQQQAGQYAGQTLHHVEQATGKGPTVTLQGSDIDGKLIQGPPAVSLGGFSDGSVTSGPSTGQGSESDFIFKMTGMKSTQLGTYLIGAGCILAGGLVAYFLNPMLGIIIMAIGGLIFGIGVVAESYPWAFLVVFLLAATAVVTTGVYLVVKQKQLNKTATAADDSQWGFDKLVAAIDTFTKAHPDKAQAIKNVVQYETDDEYKNDFKQMVLDSKVKQNIKPPDVLVQAVQAKKT